ncbi:MAG: hypothetical protein A2958_01500 [Candidatus Levybacteria bacterium RIFCSPLOWO2_01_FULL_38_13]|nr:MAG: hypothetical protein A2629_01570 [Candidatus Levybacteria bacterium RIFCSPHIGHO2_01_FULL_41_15]OGH34624.1 MAG: hypothetical protein A2958_01500 [Candidatus Levybacteria bacterium RIFCSPLOWO2_01_FULL_38_13]
MFENRREAGKLLAEKLSNFRKDKEALVLGITRGGVVVAFEIAKKLHIPLDIIIIKKIGAPGNPELAIGAVGPKKVIYWEKDLLKKTVSGSKYRKKASEIKIKEREELEEFLRGPISSPLRQGSAGRARLRRIKKKKPLEVRGKKVILVDDGVATGATVLCALKFLRKEKSREVILAAPVIARDTYLNIKKYFDTVTVMVIPERLYAIGQFYREFGQVENEEVKDIIDKQ